MRVREVAWACDCGAGDSDALVHLQGCAASARGALLLSPLCELEAGSRACSLSLLCSKPRGHAAPCGGAGKRRSV